MDKERLIQSNITKYRSVLQDGNKLIAVSKYYEVDDIMMAYKTSQYDFGEARVPSLQKKAGELELIAPRIIWHFIGHLQSNKINSLFKIKGLKYIHSIDSLNLLENIYKKASLLGSEVNFFLQINSSGEDEKSGFLLSDRLEGELKEAISLIRTHESRDSSNLKFKGLMTMSKLRTDDFQKDAQVCFESVFKLRAKLEKSYGFKDLKLSMGMSQDYKIAIEEGADFIRIGRGIFKGLSST